MAISNIVKDVPNQKMENSHLELSDAEAELRFDDVFEPIIMDKEFKKISMMDDQLYNDVID